MLAISYEHINQNRSESEFSSDIALLRQAFEESWSYEPQITPEDLFARAPVKDLLKALLYRHIHRSIDSEASGASSLYPVNPVLDTLLATSHALLSLMNAPPTTEEQVQWSNNLNHVILVLHHLLVACSPVTLDQWCPHRRVLPFGTQIAQAWKYFMDMYLTEDLRYSPMPWSEASRCQMSQRYSE